MLKVVKRLTDTVWVRLSVWVVLFVAVIIGVTLSALFHFSRKAIEEEAIGKATQTLNATVMRIDNALHKVEIAARSMHWNVEHHLESPAALQDFATQILQSYPSIAGCAIAMDPDYYPQKGGELMVYAYREVKDGRSNIVIHDSYGQTSYLQQNWYLLTSTLNHPIWIKPDQAQGYDMHLAAYCQPIHNEEGQVVGVMGVGILLDNFSKAILETKPFPNSYCTMIGRKGTYIIHPDTAKLHNHTVYDLLTEHHSPHLESTLKSLMAGKTGYEQLEVDGKDYYVFYRPFYNRGWVAAIVCPKSDIVGAGIRLQNMTILLAAFGIFFLLIVCLWLISKALEPLGLLNKSAKQLAEGNYDTPIPPTDRPDEIGSLQNSFVSMQTSIAQHMENIKTVNEALKESNAALFKANEQAQEAERVKMAFIRNMSDQMMPPVEAIEDIVNEICSDTQVSPQHRSELAAQLEKHTERITHMLDILLEVAQKKGGSA